MPTDVGQMLDQCHWYRDASGNWFHLSEMGVDSRGIAARRLKQFALSFANSAFRDLYAYGYPSGEQAQWEVDRAEAEAEHIMASQENAEQWIVRTPLYEALTGRTTPADHEEMEDGYEELAATHEPVRSRLGLTPTVYVGVSNTDGKLSCEEWQRFHMEANAALARHAVGAGTLRWFSPPTEARLGALFAAKVEIGKLDDLRKELNEVRVMYRQDEIAFALATEDFIS